MRLRDYEKKMFLGCRAKHLLDGTTGVIVGKNFKKCGLSLYLLRPFGDGEIREQQWVDAYYVVPINVPLINVSHITFEESGSDFNSKFNFGDLVKHELSGFTGMVQVKYAFITGEINYEVLPPIDESGYMRKAEMLEESELTLIPKELSLAEGLKSFNIDA